MGKVTVMKRYTNAKKALVRSAFCSGEMLGLNLNAANRVTGVELPSMGVIGSTTCGEGGPGVSEIGDGGISRVSRKYLQSIEEMYKVLRDYGRRVR